MIFCSVCADNSAQSPARRISATLPFLRCNSRKSRPYTERRKLAGGILHNRLAFRWLISLSNRERACFFTQVCSTSGFAESEKKAVKRTTALEGKKMVGVRGFEPPASASRTQRSSQTEPHPDKSGSQTPARLSNIISTGLKIKPRRLLFWQKSRHRLFSGRRRPSSWRLRLRIRSRSPDRRGASCG